MGGRLTRCIESAALAHRLRTSERARPDVAARLRYGNPTTSSSAPGWPRIGRDIYLTEDPRRQTAPQQRHRGCTRRGERDPSLGQTLERSRAEILNHHAPALQRTDRGSEPVREEDQACGRGFTCFEHYRLRVLLHVVVHWPRRPHAKDRTRGSLLQRGEPCSDAVASNLSRTPRIIKALWHS